jgi:acyl transferase domain-containing protein/acyl carrier protein
MIKSKIAVIGISGVFPGAQNIEELWQNLLDKKTGLVKIPKDKLDKSEKDIAKNVDYLPYRGILADAMCFDYEFFGYSKKDAINIDPQQRIMLQVAWNAFEDAGIMPDLISERNIGVFVGSSENTYIKSLKSNSSPIDWKDDFLINIGNLRDLIATRISYIFNLHGPSINIQTGCSTSLSALYEASRSILIGDCDIALVGAAAIRFPQNKGHVYYPGGVYSNDGKCNPFEKHSSGTVSGNGVAAMIIKRLDKAINDKDRIYSVINTIQSNNDGSRKAGFTAPSIEGQVELIKKAFEKSKINVNKIGYIEAHGTATPLGDPIEFESLKEAISMFTDKKNFSGLGSIKSTIGHLDACSGIAGFIKASLCLYHNIIPPHPHFMIANDNIDLSNSPFFINNKLTDLNSKYVCVNSLGIGGTNVFAILEKAPLYKNKQYEQNILFIPHSVKEKALVQYNNKRIQNFITKNSPCLSLLSSSMLSKKIHYKYKGGFWIETSKDNKNKYLNSSFKVQSKNGKTIFLFPGGGNIYNHALTELYFYFPSIKKYINEAISFLSSKKDQKNIHNFFYQSSDSLEFLEYQKNILYNLIITFIINYVIGNLLIENDVIPDMLMGHSLGEYNCAVLSSALKLEDAIRIIEKRAIIFKRLNNFLIINIFESRINLEQILKKFEFEIIASNTPTNYTIILPSSDQKEVINILTSNNIQFNIVELNTAVHSSHLNPYLEEFNEAIKDIVFSAPKIPVIGNLTGGLVDKYNIEYFVNHLRKEVEFQKSIVFALNINISSFIQVGSGSGLLAMIKSMELNNELNLIPTLGENSSSEKTDFLNALAAIYLIGKHRVKFYFSQNISTTESVPLPQYFFKKNDCLPAPFLPDASLSEETTTCTLYTEKSVSYLLNPSYTNVNLLENKKSIHFIKLLNDKNTDFFKNNREAKIVINEFDPDIYSFYADFINYFTNLAVRNNKDLYMISLYIPYINAEKFFSDVLPLRACINCINQELSNITIRIIGHNADDQNFADNRNYDDLLADEKVCYISSEKIFFPSYLQYNFRSFDRLKLSYNTSSEVILLIGGMGRVGMHLLEKIITETKDNVIVIGRREIDLTRLDQRQFPELSEENYLFLSNLITSNILRISYISCDVSNIDNVNKLNSSLKQVGVKMLRSVIMSASSSNLDSIRKVAHDVQYRDLKEQIDPKDIALSFVNLLVNTVSTNNIIVFSSNASRLGGPGMISYALANALLDRKSSLNSNQFIPIISICFDAFRFTNERSETFQKSDNFINESQLFNIFLECIDLEHSLNLIVSNQDYERRINTWVMNCKNLFNENVISDLKINNINQKSSIKEVIAFFWYEILGIEINEINSNFFQVGGNSLLAFKLLSKINSYYDISFTLYELKKYPTLDEVCNLIAEKKKSSTGIRIKTENILEVKNIEGLLD